MKSVYIRKRWLPISVPLAAAVIYTGFLIQSTVDHLDRLRPDWTGLSRALPFFAYIAILIIVFGASATHIKVAGSAISRYHTPLPFVRRLTIPVSEIEQVLFWQHGAGWFTRYGLAVQTRAGRRVLFQFFRSRDEVLAEVRKIADALGSRGLTTVKVAETRAAVTPRSLGNPWVIVSGIALLIAFYRLAQS